MPALINRMTLENDKYFETFKSELSQIHEKSKTDKKIIEEQLLADLIRLSKTNRSAEDFFGVKARPLARKWAEELPVPSLLDILKTNLSWLFYGIILAGLQWYNNPSKLKYNFIFTIIVIAGFLLTILGSYALSKYFPKISPKIRKLLVSSLYLLFILLALVYLFLNQ